MHSNIKILTAFYGPTSYNGWQPARHDLDNLWLNRGLPSHELEKIKEWAQLAICETVWIRPSEDIQNNFAGNVLGLCIAADFNYFINSDGSANFSCMTNIGKAEQQLKYCYHKLTQSEIHNYCTVMDSAMQRIFNLLPLPSPMSSDLFGRPVRVAVSPVPAVATSQSKIAWFLASHMAKKNNLICLQPTLDVRKPEMKTLPVSQKIAIWKGLFSEGHIINVQKSDVFGNIVIIIDDLYQSGASVWAYAEYLKEVGASAVYSLVCVKSMRDTDNV